MTDVRAGGDSFALHGLTLALDASTARGSVAVLRDGAVAARTSATMRGATEERLMPAVAAALDAADVRPGELTRVVCGGGPGGFTGLRIAAGIAKGIALASGVPLYAVSSLALVVAGEAPSLPPGRYAAVTDAMRGERFVQPAELRADGQVVPSGPARLVAVAELGGLAQAEGWHCLGPQEPGHVAWPEAAGIVRLAGSLAGVPPVSLGAWEPDYGRLAEAQVKWEAAHGRALPAR
ncbi:MAG TPA: tRNA (adenosine(37)-N6)-threonylcarbamoyltransferase complex dimerization subunit type 1 TsaB [Gemmatimonadaceae bacterium]|nr:tRNA (adenosine(37)-N6)-threonylcarbamoyltransferase complex dimerization subunit type 1 TsaB [Gemmatimonadaceae bacterium]